MFEGGLPKRVELKVLFIGDDECEKNKIIAAYKTGVLQTDKNPILQTSIPIKKALKTKSGEKPTKVNVSFFNVGSETEEMSRRLLFAEKDVYVFMFSYRSVYTLKSVIMKWAEEAFESRGSSLQTESAQVILLGVHAEAKNLENHTKPESDRVYESLEDLDNLLVFTNTFVRNATVALNANAYIEIYNNEIQSIRSGIDNIIKMGLIKDGLYSPEKIDGYIEVKSPKDWGRLDVSVKKAAGLVPKDSNGLSDPYALFGWCTRSKWETITNRQQTKRIKETLNPVWDAQHHNNTKQYQFSEALSKHQYFKVQIWDHDITSKDDFEGEANVPLSIILSNPNAEGEITMKLHSKSFEQDSDDETPVTGTVTVSWKFKPRKRKLPKTLKQSIIGSNLSKAQSTSSKSKTTSNEKSIENIKQNG